MDLVEHPTFLGVRRSAWIEVALFFAVAFLLGGGSRFEQMNPHPYWLIIVLMAAQYGSGEALLAAVCATAALRLGNMVPESISADAYEWAWQSVRQPLYWFLAAGILGEVRRRHRTAERNAEDRAAQAVEHAAACEAALKRVNDARQNLEAAMAAQLSSAATLYRAAKKVEQLDPQRVLEGSLDLVRAVVGCDQFSLYHLVGGRLELTLAHGWSEAADYARSFGAEEALFRRIVADQAFLCAAKDADERVLAHQGLLAGPLLDSETGTVLGMLKIERMGFLALNQSALEGFRAVCGWIAEAYAKAQRHRAGAIVDTSTQLYSRVFFERESAFLTKLAQRLNFPLSAAEIEIDSLEQLSAEERRRAAGILGESVRACLRTTDLAFETSRDHSGFTILLTATPVAGAPLAVAKLEGDFRRRAAEAGTKAALRSSWRSLHEPDDRPPAIHELAAVHLGSEEKVEQRHG